MMGIVLWILFGTVIILELLIIREVILIWIDERKWREQSGASYETD